MYFQTTFLFQYIYVILKNIRKLTKEEIERRDNISMGNIKHEG